MFEGRNMFGHLDKKKMYNYETSVASFLFRLYITLCLGLSRQRGNRREVRSHDGICREATRVLHPGFGYPLERCSDGKRGTRMGMGML